MVPFPLPLPETERDFPLVLTEDLVVLLEVKLTDCGSLLCDWVPMEFLTQICLHQVSSNSLVTNFPTLALLLMGFCFISLWSSVSTYPFFPVLKTVVCPVTSFLSQILEDLLIFQVFQLFILFFRTEWWLLISLHSGLETGSLY